MTVSTPDIHAILRDYWGYEQFRPAQEDIIRSVLAGNDTIGLLPTGGGKSLTFQIPALAIEGLTVVVSPLISLMKDQVDNLRQKGIPAVYLHSGLTRRESVLAIDRCRLGKAKILYLSPEKLSSPAFADTLRMLDVSLIVVDEAHCISQWGYDFRPSYLKIAQLRGRFPGVPVLALTASATPEVLEDIARQLLMRHPSVFRLSFHRHNISYVVRITDHKEQKLLEILSKVAGSAIVYVRSRRRTKEIAESLRLQGIPAEFYHAGLEPQQKEERQNRWKDGETRVIVATNAFGMGIDKPDVRVVVHMDLPSSLEEYYQEAGRAGRDGKPSFAITVASMRDKGLLTRRLSEAFPPKDYVRKIYSQACAFLDIPVGGGYNTVNEFNFPLFCVRNNLQPTQASAALHILSQTGIIDYSDEISTRSRVMFLMTKDELYALDLSRETDAVLRQILRTYPGLFADYVHISETLLAQETALTEQQVYEALLALTRMKVLHYVPKKTAPFIFFPSRREEEHNVVIPRTVYEERRDSMSRRIESMKRFVYGQETCRANVILEYFGETPHQDCGICDSCRGRKRTNVDAEDLTPQIIYMLRHGRPMRISRLATEMGVSNDRVSETVRNMLAEGKLRVSGLGSVVLNPDATSN